MGRRTTRRTEREKKGSERPSLFFIIALAIGITFLVWLFVHLINRPMPRGQRGQGAASSISCAAKPLG